MDYAHALPSRIHVTAGPVVDCTQAVELVEGLQAEALIADRGYDTDEIVAYAEEHEMEVIIPPKCNRKVEREYDKHVYCVRHLVENAFRTLKEWRGIATRYAKRTSSFLACLQIRCLLMWLRIS